MSLHAPSPAKMLSRSLPAMAGRWLPLLAVGFMLVLGGCGGGGGGGTMTPPPDDGGDDGGGDTAIEPTLASIQENVFSPICTRCHSGGGAPQGLRLEADVAYGMLVNVASAEVPGLLRVDPGNPDDSYLIHKLEGTQAVGDRMPQGGPYLSADTIAAIRQWITDGAPETATAGTQDKATLTGAWPVPDSTLAAAPGQILLIADAELDVSLLRAGLIEVVNLDNIDPVTLKPRPVEGLRMQITSLAPTVIRLDAPVESWGTGHYEVRVDGTGALAVADRSGRVIDGNEDGTPGGDFVLNFAIEPAR